MISIKWSIWLCMSDRDRIHISHYRLLSYTIGVFATLHQKVHNSHWVREGPDSMQKPSVMMISVHRNTFSSDGQLSFYRTPMDSSHKNQQCGPLMISLLFPSASFPINVEAVVVCDTSKLIWRQYNAYAVWCVFVYHTIYPIKYALHDDVIKWKHFPSYWPFVRGIHRWIPHTKASDAELWLFFNKRLSKQS